MNKKLKKVPQAQRQLQHVLPSNRSIIKVLIYSSIYIMTIMNLNAQENIKTVDNSNKSILARGCDPTLSLQFSKVVPPLIGDAAYIPTTDDTDFIKKLETQKWSVIYFAPGACRYSAAKRQIPGGNYDTQGWSLEEYKGLIRKLQGDDIQIVESLQEQGAIALLNDALAKARETK